MYCIKKVRMTMQNQNENGQIQPSYGKKLWYLWGPVVMRWVISMVVGIALMFAYMSIYIYQHPEETTKAMKSQEEMMNMSLNVSERMMQYLTEMEGIIALVTIPIMVIWFLSDRKKEKEKGAAINKKTPLLVYAGVIIMAITLCIALNNLLILSNLNTLSESYEQTMEGFYQAKFVIQIVCLGILTPISEELVFRGLLFKRLRGQGGFLQAALYSSAVFGFLHMNLVQMIYGFAFGLMLAYVYEKCGSIKAPIVAHVVANLVSVTFTEYQVFDIILKDVVSIGVVTAGCAAIASTMFVLMQRLEEK